MKLESTFAEILKEETLFSDKAGEEPSHLNTNAQQEVDMSRTTEQRDMTRPQNCLVLQCF